MSFAARLVAYVPAGGRVADLLLDSVSWDASFPHDDVSALSLSYPSVAAAAAVLDGPVELAVEVTAGSGWVEPRNARFLSSEVRSNLAEALDVPKYTFRGLGALLERPFILRKADNPGKPYDSDDKRNFLSASAGQIILSVVQESRAKYSKMLQGITFGFTASKDSLGNNWNKLDSLAFEPGTDLLRILEDATARGICDWWMQGRELMVVNADSAAVTRSLRLNLVDATESPVRATFEGMATRVALEGAEGRYWERAVAGASVPYGDRIVRAASDAISTDGTALDLLDRNALQATAPRREYTRAIAVIDSAPLVDWLVGDWVQMRGRDAWESVRVFEAGLSYKASDAVLSARVTLNDRFVDASVRDAKRLKGIAHGTTQNLGSGGIPSRSDKAVPAAPKGVAANSLGYWLDAIPLSSVDVSWQAVNTDTNGLALNGVEYYEVSCGGQRKRVTGTSAGFDGLQPSRIHTVSVYAVSSTGIRGRTASTDVLTAYPLAKLDPPTRPVLTTGLGSIQIQWDGKLQGSGAPYAPPLHFNHVLVETRLVSVAGSPWVRWPQDHGLVQTGLEVGAVYEVRLVAVDMLGRESDPSPLATVTVASSVDDALREAAEAAEKALEARAKALEAMEKALENEGGIQGALDEVAGLDDRLTPELEAAKTAASDAATDAAAAVQAANSAITETSTEYAVGASATVAPTSGWSTNTPVVPAGSFAWMRTVVTYGSGGVVTTSAVRVQGDPGAKGDTGAKGADGVAGKDGVGLKSTAVTYAKSTSGTSAPSSGWGSSVPSSTPGQYLWTRTVWTYTDNTTETGYSVAMWGATGSKGDTGSDGIAGKDGVGIKTTVINYAKSTSGTATPTTGWGTTVPAATPGQYLWTRTAWTYTDNTSETGYSVAMWGTAGAKGDTGDTGSAGISVTDVTPYYRAAASTPAQPSGANPSGWTTTQPTVGAGQYLYKSERISYSNGSYTWTPVTVEQALTVAANLQATIDAGLMRAAKASQPPTPSKGLTWLVLDEPTGSKAVGLKIANSSGSGWGSYQLLAEDVLVLGEDGNIRLKNGVVTADNIVASEALSAKLAEFLTVKASTIVGDTAAINQAFLKQFVGDQGFVDEFLASQIVVSRQWWRITKASGKITVSDTGLDVSNTPTIRYTDGRAYIDDSGATTGANRGVSIVNGKALLTSESELGSTLIKPSGITTPMLTTKLIDTEHLKTGALDAFQITSPLIQSVSTANRGIKWNGSTFVAYDNSGVEMIRLEGDTGAITGVTITGGTVRTAASGQRIQLVSSGDLYAYSSGNIEVLRLQSSDTNGGSSYFYGPTNSGYRSYMRLGVGTIDGITTPQAWLGFDGGERASSMWVHGNGAWYIGGSRGNVQVNNSSGELRLTAGSSTNLVGVYNLPTTTSTGEPLTTILGGSLRSLYRNTSLRKYKLDIADLSADDPYRVLQLQPRDWYDRTALDQVVDGMEAEYLRAQGEEVPERLALREAMPLPHRVPGFVAEEVVEVIPKLASWDGDGNLSGVAYDRVAAYLLVAMKAMKTEIDELREHLERGL